VCEGLEFMGIEIDPQFNEGLRAEERVISKEGSRVKVIVVPTNEELMIAIDTQNIVCKKELN
jgi:acetate kinase